MLALLFIYLLGCSDVGQPDHYSANWTKIDAPPNSPQGTVCYVWYAAWGQGRYGGPVCFDENETVRGK